MRLRVLSYLLLLCCPACQLAAQATSNAQKFSPPARTFRLTYNFTVKAMMSIELNVQAACIYLVFFGMLLIRNPLMRLFRQGETLPQS